MLQPSEIRLEASTRCQLRCPACPTTQGRIKDRLGTGFLSLAHFRSLVDQNPWVHTIELSNWGEIFLNPELPRIIEHAFRRGVRLKATNGVNLNHVTEEMLELLVRYRFHALKISIDGTTNDVYTAYRKGGDLDQVMGAIRRLNELKAAHGTRYPKLKWQFIAFGHNEHQIEEARAMARSLGMKFWVKLAWKNKQTKEPVADVRDKEHVALASGTGASTREEFYAMHGERYMQRHSCSQLWISPQINWDGRVLGCNVLHGGDFGNAFDDGLLASLNGEKIRYAREMLFGREPPRDDIPCTQCKHYRAMKTHRRWIVAEDVQIDAARDGGAPKAGRRTGRCGRVLRWLRGVRWLGGVRPRSGEAGKVAPGV